MTTTEVDELKVVSLDKIIASDVAMRTVDRTSESYLGLVDSIKAKGLISCITVRKKFDPITGIELYELIDGAQRSQAARDAGLKEIKVNVMSMSDADAMEAQLMANVHRVDTPACAYSAHLKRMMMMNPKLTVPVLSDKIAMSTAWVSARLSLVRITDPDIKQLVDSGQINITNAYALAKLPPENQRELVDQAMTLSPQEFIPVCTQRAKEIREANRKGEDEKPLEFAPQPFIQKLKVLKTEHETREVGKMLIDKYKPKTLTDAFNLAIDWTLHLDPASIELQRSKHDERVRAREEKKAQRIKERAEKAAEQQRKLAEEAAKIQAQMALK